MIGPPEGTPGAYGRFDLDYWALSYREAGRWLVRNATPGSVVWVPYSVFQFPRALHTYRATADPEVPRAHPVPPGARIPPLAPDASAPSAAFEVTEVRSPPRYEPIETLSPAATLSLDCDEGPFHGRPVRLRYRGLLRVPAAGDYCFEVRADEHAVLRLNGQIVTEALEERARNRVRLERGLYRTEVLYYNRALVIVSRIAM